MPAKTAPSDPVTGDTAEPAASEADVPRGPVPGSEQDGDATGPDDNHDGPGAAMSTADRPDTDDGAGEPGVDGIEDAA